MEYSTWIMLSLSVVLASVDNSLGQNGTSRDSGSERGAVEEAMMPFYSMTNNFLEVVQPKSSDWSILKWVADTVAKDFKISEENLDWQTHVSKYKGVVVCVAIGLAFVVIMPIVGLILCCCRCCCGNCGAHADSKPDKHDRCSHYVCSMLLFVFSMFILAGTILVFITNEYLWQQTVYDNKGVMHDTEETLKYIETYKLNGKNDFVRLGNEIKVKVDSVVLDVKRMPKVVGESFIKDLDVDNVLQAAQDLQTSVTSIKNDLTIVDTSLNQLKTSGTSLVSQLNDLSSRMSNTIQGCADPRCNELRSKVASLQGLADFTKVDDVTTFLDGLRSVQLNDVYDRAVSEYRKIESTLDGSISNELQTIEDIGEEIKLDVDKTILDVAKLIDDELDLGNVNEEINSVKPTVQEFGNYRKYAGIAIGCALLITGVLFFLGLLFGCFGSDPDSESACNKATGANLLMGGIVWAFVFSAILMLIVILLFVSGGLAYTDGCRNLVYLGQTPESIRALDSLSKIMKESGVDVNLKNIVVKCMAGKGAYEAFNLSRFVNIDEELDVEKYNLQAELDRLKKLRRRLPSIDIINDDNFQQLTELGNANLQNVDFDSFYEELQYDLTSSNLITLADEADNVVAQLRAAGDSNRANTLQSQANKMRSIHTTTVTPMIGTKGQLELAVRSLELSVKGTSGTRVFNDYVYNLKEAFEDLQHQINLRSSDLSVFSTYLATEAQRIYDDIKDYLDYDVKQKIKEDIGDCGALYDRINYLFTTSLCERVVNPYNAFWFSVGWCLFFFIPSIIVAWNLNIQYRRVEYYGSDKGYDHFRY